MKSKKCFPSFLGKSRCRLLLPKIKMETSVHKLDKRVLRRLFSPPGTSTSPPQKEWSQTFR